MSINRFLAWKTINCPGSIKLSQADILWEGGGCGKWTRLSVESLKVIIGPGLRLSIEKRLRPRQLLFKCLPLSAG